MMYKPDVTITVTLPRYRTVEPEAFEAVGRAIRVCHDAGLYPGQASFELISEKPGNHFSFDVVYKYESEDDED